MRRVDYHALYPSRVVTQHADGSLDLVPDSARAPSCQRVPVRTLRGVTLTVAAGARVLLGYEGGDPSKPYASLWEAGNVTRFAVNGASTKAARDGESVVRSSALDTWISAVSLATGVTAPVGAIGTVSGGSDVVRIP